MKKNTRLSNAIKKAAALVTAALMLLACCPALAAAAPAPPTPTAKNADATSIELSWDKASGAKSYIIYRSTRRSGGYKQGNEIACHGFDHSNFLNLSNSGVASQISRTRKLLKKAIGKEPSRLVRPPYGSVNDRILKGVNVPFVNWSVDTLDWKTRSESATIKCVMNTARDGDIVLMHDIHAPTVRAAAKLIPKLLNKGVQLVTVSELAAI